MKHSKKILAVVLCMLMMLTPLASVAGTVTVQAATQTVKVKKDQKTGNRYGYDKNNKKVTQQWGVTASGYRYYFGKNGAAYSGSVKLGVKTPAVKKIGTKYYGFDTNARMLKGIYVINDKFYVFNSKTGVYDSAKSSKLRKAYGYEKKAATLKKLLGKPKKTEKLTGCYGNGKEYMLYYQNFVLSTGETSKGVEIIFGVLPY